MLYLKWVQLSKNLHFEQWHGTLNRLGFQVISFTNFAELCGLINVNNVTLTWHGCLLLLSFTVLLEPNLKSTVAEDWQKILYTGTLAITDP